MQYDASTWHPKNPMAIDNNPNPDLASSELSDPSSQRQRQLISRVLSPALRLWLRSQLEQVEQLTLTIDAGDRQLLKGEIQQVMVAAESAIYQGLCLTQVRLTAEQIRTNLGQMLRGKPLRLEHPFPVVGEVQISEADLNTSLQAPLLANPIKQLLTLLLSSGSGIEAPEDSWDVTQLQARLVEGALIARATLVAPNGKTTPANLRTGLGIEQGQRLLLQNPQWLPHARATRGLPLRELDGYTFDLGNHVQIRRLEIHSETLLCQGQIWVLPE